MNKILYIVIHMCRDMYQSLENMVKAFLVLLFEKIHKVGSYMYFYVFAPRLLITVSMVLCDMDSTILAKEVL